MQRLNGTETFFSWASEGSVMAFTSSRGVFIVFVALCSRAMKSLHNLYTVLYIIKFAQKE